MRKTMFFLSLMLVLSLVLAACGGANQEDQGTQTVPDIGTTELPDTGLQGTETTGGLTATETTGLTSTETTGLAGTETTGGLTATETPLALETSTPSVSATQAPSVSATDTTGGLATGTQTAVLPPTGMADPSRLTTLMTFDARNSNGDVLGDVNNMVIDLGSNQILYVLVGSGGFLGIGERQIPVPYTQMQINPACLAAMGSTSSTGATGGTGSATSTETAGTGGTGSTGTVTGTETAGTTGTGTMEAGMDNCYFLLNVDADVLRNAPNFDQNQMPDINTTGWDAEFNQYWQENGTSSTGSTGTGTSGTGNTSGTGSAAATETPGAGTGSTSGSGSAAGTATPSSSTGTTGTTGGANAQANNRLILADELLGLNVVAGDATSSTGGTTSGSGSDTSGTGSTTSTETAGAGATSTETAGTGTSGTAAAGETLGTITDAIVELQTGIIRYYIVTGDTAMGATSGRLLPIPPQAFSFAGTGDTENLTDVMLNVNNMILSQAPTFDEGTLPNASIQGWDTGLRNYWTTQGFNTMTNP